MLLRCSHQTCARLVPPCHPPSAHSSLCLSAAATAADLFLSLQALLARTRHCYPTIQPHCASEHLHAASPCPFFLAHLFHFIASHSTEITVVPLIALAFLYV